MDSVQAESEDEFNSNEMHVPKGNGEVEQAVSEEEIFFDLPPIEEGDLLSAVEALLFASAEPLAIDKLSKLLGRDKNQLNKTMEELKVKLQSEERGLELIEVASGFQLRTKKKFGTYVRVMRAEKPRRLSSAALETLAVIAYRQPIVKNDIETIRGVDSTPTLKTLLERGLIRIVGHQQTVGTPALYGTADEFLKIFGLKSLAELPTLREIRMIEGDPGEEGEEYTQS